MAQGIIASIRSVDCTIHETDMLIRSFFHALSLLPGKSAGIIDTISCKFPFVNSRANTKENILLKYGRQTTYGDCVVFSQEEWKDLLGDIKKIWEPVLFNSRNWFFVINELPDAKLSKACSVHALFIKAQGNSIPEIYQYVKNIQNNKAVLKLIIYGEKEIETAAEFFLKIKKEIAAIADNHIPLEFSGFLNVPLEEKDLLYLYNKDIVSAFPGSTLHGQLNYCLQKLFLLDQNELEPLNLEKLLELKG